MTSWSKNDELFFSELKAGHDWQKLPALFLKLNGLNVEVPDLTIRSSIKEASKWKDTADLTVNGYIIEIKSRNEAFTSAASFPYDTIFVDTVSGYKAKSIKPLAYVMVSRKTGGMLALFSASSDAWKIEEKFDRVRRIKESFYVAEKKDFMTLEPLIEKLKISSLKE